MTETAHEHAHHAHIPEWSELTFSQLWSPFFMISMVLIIVAYLLVTGPFRYKLSASATVTSTWRKWTFCLGIVFIYIASGSPLSPLGHDYMFAAHMLQQSILYLFVPPLILLGIPKWWFARWEGKRWMEITIKVLQHPLFALLNFNVFFSFYHIPYIFDTMRDIHWMMIAYHVWLQICAVQMWLLVINPFPGGDRLRPLQKIGYIFANGVLLTPACALIIFAPNVLYDTYANTPVVFDLFSKLDDQQLGGVIMKLLQELAYGITLAIVFYHWFYSERSKEKRMSGNQPAV